MLSLLVIRVEDIDQSVKFYEKLGLNFKFHRHGNGPYHYSTKLGQTIFEIYPTRESKPSGTQELRFGIIVENCAECIKELKLSYPSAWLKTLETEWGRIDLIQDVDGNKIELSDLIS